jgi:hypothetical protein
MPWVADGAPLEFGEPEKEKLETLDAAIGELLELSQVPTRGLLRTPAGVLRTPHAAWQ